MTPECRVRVARVLGRNLSDAEAAELDRRMIRSERYLARFDPEFAGQDRKVQLARVGDHAGQLVQAEADGLVRSFDMDFQLREAGRDMLGDDFDALERSGRVRMLDRASDLPQYRSGEHDDALAVTLDDGQVVLFRDRMSPDAMPEIMLHELGMHAGMEGYLGAKGWETLKAEGLKLVDDGVAARQANLEAGRDAYDGISPEARAAAEAWDRVPGDTRPEHIADEVLAYWVQFAPAKDPFVSGLLGKMRAWIFRHVPWVRGRVKLTHETLKALTQGALRREIRQARKLVRSGDGPVQSVPASAGGRFSKRDSGGSGRILSREHFTQEMLAIRKDWAPDEIDRAYQLHKLVATLEGAGGVPGASSMRAADAGIELAGRDAIEARGGAGGNLVRDSEVLESELRAELADGGGDPDLFEVVHPETGERVPASRLLEEMDEDRKMLERLRHCAYPGGKT